MNNEIEQEVRSWLEKVVLGLNLCPFARKPYNENAIRFRISEATDDESLLIDLQDELHFLDKTLEAEVATSLLIIKNCLDNFDDYNNFLDWVDFLLMKMNWEGVYQVASFHPDYRFAGTELEAAENLTNRSPYPILHIIREEQMAEAIKHYPEVDAIPERNIKNMEALSLEERRKLFPYIDFPPE